MRSFIFNADIFSSIFKTHNLNHPPCHLFLPNLRPSVCFYLCFYINSFVYFYLCLYVSLYLSLLFWAHLFVSISVSILMLAFISISAFMSLYICLCCFELSLSLYLSLRLVFFFLVFQTKIFVHILPSLFSPSFAHSPTQPLSHTYTHIPTQSLITNTFTNTYYLSLPISLKRLLESTLLHSPLPWYHIRCY